MKHALYALAAGTMLAALPAAAQSTYDPYRYPGTEANANAQIYAGENGFRNRIAQLDARLQAGVRSGQISTSEARPIRQQIRYLIQLEQRYAANGLTQQERQDLQRRWRYTRQALRAADPNNGGYAQWDREDPYGPNYRDANNDGYDDAYNNGGRNNDGGYNNGGYNNDGYNNGSYNNGGYNDDRNNGTGRYRQVNEVCRSRGTLGGILSAVFGTDNCLRVGERVTTASSLSALPNQLRGEFRDSDYYTYRYVDGNVVEIDTRTSVVARIYVVT
ncbi:MAG TPA: hypothetical protein VHG29_04340 [Novosphingobium sp.]|nr:hypothetical protein [Novosphingobium sp.]